MNDNFLNKYIVALLNLAYFYSSYYQGRDRNSALYHLNRDQRKES